MLMIPLITILCTAGSAFSFRFLFALCKECKAPRFNRLNPRLRLEKKLSVQPPPSHSRAALQTTELPLNRGFELRSMLRTVPWKRVAALVICACALAGHAQITRVDQPTPDAQNSQAMQARIEKLENEVSELKVVINQLQAASPRPTEPKGSDVKAQDTASPEQQNVVGSEDRKILDFLRNTTINVGLDTYYGNNFNNPVGRVNLLRTYDVLSNEFSINQASVIFEHAPNLNAGRRWGGRLDLQFGQATDTLQGNPSNEPRPQIYRNIFQAYGTYVVPVGKGITVDFGKWGSSLGIEGNYTKDQMNYSRAYWFDFLPFYHMGVRASIPLSDRFAVNYWVVNGTNHVEATNGFKDQLFGFTAKPAKAVTWTMNYYLGQENPDRAPSMNCGPIPVQPGLCFTGITPAPNGRTHIFDSY